MCGRTGPGPDFRGDPRTMVERYFDAFLYMANWGTRRPMIRLPARLLDLDTAQRLDRAFVPVGSP